MPSSILNASVLKTSALRLGFSACGVAPAEPVETFFANAYKSWIAEGMQADMAYLENHTAKRLNPVLLMDGAQSVISVALNYYPSELLDSEKQYEFAWYAYGQDYHEVMKARLTTLAETMLKEIGNDKAEVNYRVFCDTAPVLERYWAWRCGLGWIGKNNQLIIPHAGSAFFLGEILINLPFTEYDRPQKNRCGACMDCLKACPTGALSQPYTLDARRCLSYLTIECRGDSLSDDVAHAMGNCIYGCDRCQQACPWMRFARQTEVKEFTPNKAFTTLSKKQMQQLSVEEYRQVFRGSAVKRAKYEGLMRNIRAVEKK